MIPTDATRVVAVFDDPDTAHAAVDHLEELHVDHEAIELQAGRDRAMAARRTSPEPAPTRPATGPERVPRALGLTLVAAAIGAVLAILVFLWVDVESMSDWAEIVVFGVVGALAGSAVGFVMAAGKGPRADVETNRPAGDVEQWITVAVRVAPESQLSVRRVLSEHGAVLVDVS